MKLNDSVLIPAATMSSSDSGRNDHCSEAILWSKRRMGYG